LRRYQVNLLVDAEGLQGAPVVYENNPTYLNLIGRVEHQAQMGALTTDFMLIKPGALHKANGGYLILDAQRVLMSPHSWEGLKRALQFGEIRIESPLDAMSLSTTITLEPEPIPLAVKVILMGEPNVYYLVSSFDPDFNELFKVSADFDDELHRSPEGELGFAHLIATLARKEGLRPFDSGAVASLIEHSSRMVDDGSRMSAHISEVLGLMQESNHWAGEASAERVSRLHVERAIESRVFRQNRMEEKLLDEVLRGSQLIDTAGEHVGQVNGLSVAQLGKYAFGHATRITATVRIGSGEVMDIEREVDLGGPIHSKGVMILSSLLGEKFAQSAPLSFEASLVFEQSYGGVEGDSASSTEFYALLSAIARLPIKQSIAVTGSVNQFGQVQAIGGVNAKIEGFFDLCVRRGLTGEQGVVIPASNLQHLMLKDDLLKAVEEGKFSVWTVETVDEGIELLTGVPAGDLLADGRYPEGSVYRRVVERLNEFTVARKKADDDADEDKPIIATRKRSPRRKVQPDSEPTTSDDEDSEPGVA
jgi:predicted ATP-dependent protease